MKRKPVLFFYSVLLLSLCVWQAVAISYVPPVKNYSVNDYNAGNQNWAVAQGKDGLIYVGNNRGLLQFDGVRWRLHKLPNNNAVRSIYIDSNERIYVGSFEEFGFFEIDDKGLLSYTSLKDSVSGYRFNNDEIWTISNFQNKIYFQSFTSYFVYDGTTVKNGETDFWPLYFFSFGKDLYAQIVNKGFYKHNGTGFEELFPRTSINNDDVVAVLPYNQALLLVTVMNGLFLYEEGTVFPWKTPAGEWLKTTIANRAVMMADSTYVIGTISNGLIAFDRQGNVLWKINRKNRLINNTVLGLFPDSEDNLWVALDNGISQIQVSSPVHYADFPGVDFGMVHDLVKDNGDFYLATNQGVYYLTGNDGTPKMIHDSEGQSWYISKEDRQLFVGHNKGLLILENGKAVRLPGYRGAGGTVLRKCVIHGQEILLQASYSTLSVFVKKNEKWEFSHEVKGFGNLIKAFEVDFSGNIWASHMHKGLYRLQLDNSLREVKEIEYIGKLSPQSRDGILNVMQLRGRIVLTDGQKFYTYDDMSRKIIPYERMNKYYPNLAGTYRIVAADNDNYWFVTGSEYALLAYDGGDLTMQMRFPFSMIDNPPIEGRGNVYVDRMGETYLCLNGGFAVLSAKNKIRNQEERKLSISSVKATTRDKKKSILLLREQTEPVKINYAFNNITFDFAYPNYTQTFSSSINYWLEGFENEWNDNPSDFTKNYSNLPYGSYVLHAKVYNSEGREMSDLSYPFTISPPFYRSAYAYLFYFVLIVCLLVLLIRIYVNWELSHEKKRAAEQHRLQEEQLKAQEQQIIRLEKEKLEDELTYKSKELASATLSVISHNEFLEQLKAEVQSQKLTGSYSKGFFDKLIRMINDNITKEGDWTVFQANFDRIHEKFFVKLKNRYSDLTPGDLRLCALLRLNMPTKDMAGILNLSVRGVEAARYRLRKKLNLTEGESLTSFLITFE
ncbi:triple tyrosine motif-containing protein [Massilibacteroides sp.]|uniref:triple tyrosine motif-containing protein n=1 Tax=Massilibacteroides sp. TaxID=2034766 RepID=UPI00262018CF|nr:triple tyrosine motif-containing protein [Massilibacteroides sp.]MDD4514401.1 triple tyrosine motif-containing protein [Massilibacteroides sp.]